MTTATEYNSTIAGKGVLLAESKKLLREIDSGCDPEEVRRAVIEDNLLDRRTLESRSKVWKEIFRRFISGRPSEHIETIARMATRSSNRSAADLVLFYEFCQVDDVLYDLTAYCTYELYQDARTAIDNVDINEWLTEQAAEHPEIEAWSPTTRNRLLSSYLATIRDFGLVKGVKQKEFHKLYVPREAFVYALYHQKDRGVAGKALIQSHDWRLFLLSENDVVFHLEDAANGGFVEFRRAGDVYDLRFLYNDLHEVVHAITS